MTQRRNATEAMADEIIDAACKQAIRILSRKPSSSTIATAQYEKAQYESAYWTLLHAGFAVETLLAVS